MPTEFAGEREGDGFIGTTWQNLRRLRVPSRARVRVREVAAAGLPSSTPDMSLLGWRHLPASSDGSTQYSLASRLHHAFTGVEQGMADGQEPSPRSNGLLPCELVGVRRAVWNAGGYLRLSQ